jgi:hypothetical protein
MATDIATAMAQALASQQQQQSDEPKPVGTITIRREQIVDMEPIQIRESLRPKVVADYVEAYQGEAKDSMPPLKVWRLHDHDLGDNYAVTVGFHRLAALDHIHTTDGWLHDYEIVVELYQGTLNQAMLQAASDNATHGERLSREERHAAIVRYLQLSEKSYSEIARIFAVQPSTVSRIAKEIGKHYSQKLNAASQTTDDGAKPGQKLVTRGGTTYWQNSPPGRRAEAAAPASEAPAGAPAADAAPTAPPLGPGSYVAAGSSSSGSHVSMAPTPQVLPIAAPDLTIDEACQRTKAMLEVLNWYYSLTHDMAVTNQARTALVPLLRDLEAKLREQHAAMGDQDHEQ